MTGQGIRKSTRCLWFSLGIVVAFSGSLLFLMDCARSAQAGESMQGESSGQGIDMDHRDQAEGTVDMMVPHQQHLGPHRSKKRGQATYSEGLTPQAAHCVWVVFEPILPAF